MNRPFVVVLSLALVFGVAFGADQTTQKRSDQRAQFQVTPEFSAAENIVEGLRGTPATDPESQARLQEARAVFQAALDQFPESTLALNYLARTYSFPGQDRALGIATFEKSLAIDPNQADAIVGLVDLCLDAGQRSKAAEVQARLVKGGANPELAAKVERLIALWDGSEGQRLIREGHADEGFALIDKAIQNSSDPSVQKDLREMRSAVSREWEISTYNEALAKAKAGDYRGSWNILEKLLKVAKEPEVVERAKRLREKIKAAVQPGTSD
jgi:tetratricopeptide (TPR) repeat protein